MWYFYTLFMVCRCQFFYKYVVKHNSKYSHYQTCLYLCLCLNYNREWTYFSDFTLWKLFTASTFSIYKYRTPAYSPGCFSLREAFVHIHLSHIFLPFLQGFFSDSSEREKYYWNLSMYRVLVFASLPAPVFGKSVLLLWWTLAWITKTYARLWENKALLYPNEFVLLFDWKRGYKTGYWKPGETLWAE